MKLLKKSGCLEVRRKGSHVFIQEKDDGCSTVIPVHGNEDLVKGILKSILNDLDMSVEELIKLINR